MLKFMSLCPNINDCRCGRGGDLMQLLHIDIFYYIIIIKIFCRISLSLFRHSANSDCLIEINIMFCVRATCLQRCGFFLSVLYFSLATFRFFLSVLYFILACSFRFFQSVLYFSLNHIAFFSSSTQQASGKKTAFDAFRRVLDMASLFVEYLTWLPVKNHF